jgi:hypothetical protein
MKDTVFFKQAELLLRILPLIHKEEAFALKGGTAINFFVQDPAVYGNADLIRGQFHRVILIPLPPVIQSHFVLNEFVKLHLILLIPMWLPLRHEQIHVINGTCFKNTEFLDQSRIERGFPGLQV